MRSACELPGMDEPQGMAGRQTGYDAGYGLRNKIERTYRFITFGKEFGKSALIQTTLIGI